jgi:GTP-binding protein
LKTEPVERTFKTVVVAGRPNVGKSTLFNRLIGKRRAITDPTPGVTRDAVSEPWSAGGYPCMIVDTGGYKPGTEGVFDEAVSRISLERIKTADIVLLVLDVTGITPEDRLLIEKIRPYSDKVILVVNKVDSPEREPLVWDFWSLGFPRLLAVSSAHGLAVGELEEMIAAFLKELGVENLGEGEIPHTVSVAILGKPNVGKSTLANALAGKENSLVSDVAGTTRDVVPGEFIYRNTVFRLLDTAGIRRKSKVAENVEYYSVNRAFKAIDDADIVLLMLDVTEGLTEQDKKISDQIMKTGKGVVIVLNKWDLSGGGGEKEMAEARELVQFRFPVLSFAPIIPVSALEKKRLDKLLDGILAVHAQLHTRVETGELNRALEDWTAFTPPPSIKGRSYKVRYMTQVTTAPVRFVFFVNRKEHFPESYERFLVNNIRKTFGMDQIPLFTELRES